MSWQTEDLGDTPGVPAANGPRAMIIVSLVGTLLGITGLVLCFLSGAELARFVGLGGESQAVVVQRINPDSAAAGAATYDVRFTVQWAERTGHFQVRSDEPIASAQVGDTVPVYTAPWTQEVVPVRSSHPIALGLAALLCVWAIVQGLVSARRYHHLTRPFVGRHVIGTISFIHPKNAYLEMVPLRGAADERPLVLLPAARFPYAVGDDVLVWASRRSVLLGGRPRGPWVVLARGVATAATHGWRRGA